MCTIDYLTNDLFIESFNGCHASKRLIIFMLVPAVHTRTEDHEDCRTGFSNQIPRRLASMAQADECDTSVLLK